MKKIIIALVLVFALTSCGDKTEQKVNPIDNNKNQVEQNKTDKKEVNKVNEKVKNEISDISTKLANGEITQEEANKQMQESIEKTAMSAIESQKKLMPNMLKLMKINLNCIKDTNGKDDAKVCYNQSLKLAKELGLGDMYQDDGEDFKWDDNEKQTAIKDLTKGIKDMEVMIPCIKDAKTIQDFEKCTPKDNK